MQVLKVFKKRQRKDLLTSAKDKNMNLVKTSLTDCDFVKSLLVLCNTNFQMKQQIQSSDG